MTWRKWWALEFLVGLVIAATISPLPPGRFWLAIGLTTFLFCPIYLKRVTGQKWERARRLVQQRRYGRGDGRGWS